MRPRPAGAPVAPRANGPVVPSNDPDDDPDHPDDAPAPAAGALGTVGPAAGPLWRGAGAPRAGVGGAGRPQPGG